MGKGIIFVGGGNLNRNRDQQSMYSASNRNKYNKQKSMRAEFYNELCVESRKISSQKARKKKIQQLHLKYENYACSEKNMEKVFVSYFDCFQKPVKKSQYKTRLLKLPEFLEKNNVDKRIIKRIKEVEKLEDLNQITEIKNVEKDLVSKKKDRSNRFYELLNRYLIETVYDSKVVMTSELENLFAVFPRDADYINQLKIIYQQMLNGKDPFNKKRKKRNFFVSKADERGLLKYFHLYKKLNR